MSGRGRGRLINDPFVDIKLAGGQVHFSFDVLIGQQGVGKVIVQIAGDIDRAVAYFADVFLDVEFLWCEGDLFGVAG